MKFKKKVIIDWRNFDPVKMSAILQANLQEVAMDNSASKLDRDLSIAISMTMNEVIPKRVMHIRRDTDIVNYHIEAVKKKRDRLFKQARKENNPSVMLRVKELNTVIKSIVKRERDRIIKNKIKNSSSTTFWNTVNGMLGRGSGDDSCKLVDPNGKSLKAGEAAEAFSSFFKSKVEKLINRNPIPDVPVSISHTKVVPFTCEEIELAMGSFKPKKSFGPDEIPMMVLKQCFDVLRDHLSHLFRLITDTGVIPETWKLARLKPIFKKGDRTKIENYRPISNLNSVSKLFERCLLNRIAHLETDGPNQHGFKPAHSTTTAAIEIQSHIAEHLDANKQCLIYSMDLSAAFDLIRPGIFVSKALKVIPDNGLVWLILEFIKNRKAFVELDGETSCIIEMPVGCPQGSTLGPKIFNIYCNDLYTCFEGEANLVSYADDSYVIVASEDLGQIKSKTEIIMNKHMHWLESNGMVCNVEKTEIMLLNSESPLEIEMNGLPLRTQDEMKVLGIIFDDRLNWGPQVRSAITKTNRMLHGLRKIRKYLSVKQSTQITTAFYYSVLYYGIEVWFHRHLPFHLKQKIRSAHYRALRVIYGEASRQHLDLIGGRATPDEWADYSLAKLAARMVRLGSPVRLLEQTVKNSYSERRQHGRIFFYDSSVRKIGKQCLKNRLQCISRQMKFEWLNVDLSTLRPNLKKCFFKYARQSN